VIDIRTLLASQSHLRHRKLRTYLTNEGITSGHSLRPVGRLCIFLQWFIKPAKLLESNEVGSAILIIA
jgi:hypothetical protein